MLSRSGRPRPGAPSEKPVLRHSLRSRKTCPHFRYDGEKIQMQRFSDLQLPKPLRASVLALLLPLALGACTAGAVESESPAPEVSAKACPAPGTWLDPDTGQTLAHGEVVAAAAAKDVVLLGESHDQAEHHRWQLSMLAGLKARNPGLVIMGIWYLSLRTMWRANIVRFYNQPTHRPGPISLSVITRL